MAEKQVNHIFHHWIDPVTNKPFAAMYGKFSKGLPQAKQRTISTYASGIEKGMKPATTNIGKLIGLEIEAATRAHNARAMIKNLSDLAADPQVSMVRVAGKKPKPIRMIEDWNKLQKQGLTEGYTRYSHPALDKSMVFKSGDQLVRLKGAVGVRNELYPFVKAYMDNPTYGKWSQMNFALKSMKLGISMFHPVSLAMQELANRRIPFKNIPRGLKIRKNLDPAVRLLHQEGLELFKGYEDLGYRNKFFEGRNIPEKIGNIVTYPVKLSRDLIFEIIQPGMKTSFAHDVFLKEFLPKALKKTDWTVERVLETYDKGGKIPNEALKAAREAVEAADSHFSGEHYKRALLETNRFMVKAYFDPRARKVWQGTLLSPTWQREHLIVGKNIAKSFMPESMIKKLGMKEMSPAMKQSYRRYLYSAMTIVAAVDLWNYMSTEYMDGEGKHIWENPEGKGFAVRAFWNEPDYTYINKKGKEITVHGGPTYIRPLKSLFELAEGVHHPLRKVSYKLSPWLTALAGAWNKLNWGAYSGPVGIPQFFWDLLKDTSTPIAVDQYMNVAQGKKHPLSATTSFFGMPASKFKIGDYESERMKVINLMKEGYVEVAEERRRLYNQYRKYPQMPSANEIYRQYQFNVSKRTGGSQSRPTQQRGTQQRRIQP